MSLTDDLQAPRSELKEFRDLTIRILNYFPEIITDKEITRNYVISSSLVAGTKKFIRPINLELFIFDDKAFRAEFERLVETLRELKSGKRNFSIEIYTNIDKVVYTIQQAIGVGLDLLGESNSSRKHVGNRFEELVKLIINDTGISTKKIVLKIPYRTDEGLKHYRCETDIVISPHNQVRSNSQNIDPDEIVISLKTTTKDRMGKIFVDKLLMERFVKHDLKIIGISLNDVQRKGEDKISYTLVSNLFMVYTEFLTALEGYYYLDLPPKAKESPYDQHIFSFSKFLIEDVWTLLKN